MVRRSSLALLATLALTTASPALAGPTINLGGGSSATSGTAGNTKTFVGDNGLQVEASAWSWDGSTLSKAFLGTYGTGLGVTNSTEGTGGSNSHAVDNYLKQDFILLVFNQSVNVASGVLTPYAQTTTPNDNDAAISYASVAGLFAAGSSSITTTNALWSTLGTNLWNVSGNTVSPFSTSFNSTGRTGNVWLIGGATAGDTNADGFKLTSINVTSAVPEPGTWAMMLVGFGAVGFSMRRRRPAVLQLA